MYHAWQTFFLYNTNILQISEKNPHSAFESFRAIACVLAHGIQVVLYGAHGRIAQAVGNAECVAVRKGILQARCK